MRVSQEDARQQYCDLIGSLVEAAGGSSAQVVAKPAGNGNVYETLLVTTEDNITTIKLNRPAKKNAITTDVSLWLCYLHTFRNPRFTFQSLVFQMYNEITAALEQAAKDDSIITVFTGTATHHSSVQPCR